MMGLLRLSLAELADSIKERISQYYSDSGALQASTTASLLNKTSHIIDECFKAKNRRTELKKKIAMINEEIAEVRHRSEEKANDLFKKYNKEWRPKFDINTTEVNVLLNQLSATSKEFLTSARDQEALINSVVVIGFDKLSVIFKEWATRMAGHNFQKVSDGIKNLSLLDEKFEGVPIGWLKFPPREQTFDQLMTFLDTQRVHSSNAAIGADILKAIAKQRSVLTHPDCAKADIYLMHLNKASISDKEEMMLDDQISLRLDYDPFVSYFLLILNYQLFILGKQQLKVTKRIFISLKNKFLIILSSRLGVTPRYRD